MSVDSSVALITLAQLKAWLGITGSTEDTILEPMINRSGELCGTYCGRKLKTATYTEYYNGNGTAQLQLNNFPVTAVTSINIDPTRLWAAASSVDVTANVMIGSASGIIRLWNQWAGFPCGRGNVKVVYVAGYKDSTDNLVPYDLQEASLLIAQYSYKRHYQDQRIGLQSETVGDRTMSYSNEAIPAKAKTILDSYRDLGHSADYAI
jgi:uncharacterized phiE125 gp8 family phage protein